MERRHQPLPTFSLLALAIAFVLWSGPSQAAKFSLRSDGVVLKDKEPFFPIGFFAKSPMQTRVVADLVAISDAGFNTMLAGIYASNDLPALLDEASKRGVHLIMEADSRNTSASTLLPIVNRAKDHAATLGYYIMDDAHVYVSPAQLKKKHDDVKAADPNHLTFMADYDHTAFGPLLGIADVSGPYRYPVYTSTQPLPLVDLTYAEAAKCNCSTYAIPQTFAWPNNRVPNPLEERNMVYQALAHNVKAVIFYAFDGEGYVPDNAALWSELKALAPELKAMGNVIINGQFQRAATGRANVFAAFWKLGTTYTVVIVNAQAAAQTNVSVPLPAGTAGDFAPIFANRPQGMSWSGGRIIGSMKALEVHVYRIASPPASNVDAGVPDANAAGGMSGAMDAASKGGSAGGQTTDASNATNGGQGGKAATQDSLGGSGNAAQDPESASSEGCGCRVGSRGRSDHVLAPAMMLAAFVLRRRQRRPK